MFLYWDCYYGLWNILLYGQFDLINDCEIPSHLASSFDPHF